MHKDDLPLYLFHQGTNYQCYDYMGAHLTPAGEAVFRVWAPHAEAVFLTGDFNDWGESDPMTRVSEGGVFEIKLAAGRAAPGALYKYKLQTPHGVRYKADPYAFACEKPPHTASVLCDLAGYEWRDAGWLAYREKAMADPYAAPLNIYEVHLGSFKRHEDGTPLSYRELAEDLIPYVKQMGYTHVELLPVMEHPFDGSWGYQVCGYYAPTARHGSPRDFMAFVDACHEAGVGVILDWVPAHFPKDEHGLFEFDGEPLYEYQGADRMEHKGWGTRCFDVGRQEVESFLISNADFWARVYHADGLRVDAVASMLYLDYDRMPGEWIPNRYGENKNLEAIAFFQKLNSHMQNAFPRLLMIAEESTAWGNLTSWEHGGLGFSLKWNMGWMNDTLAYAGEDPLFRSYHHDKVTFSLTYAFGERYVLPVSHDEVVHGKKSFLDKMPGTYEQKFAGVRVFLGYMMTHPGKKLLFMGSEIGQFREWDYAGAVEWFLLDYDMHAKLQNYAAALNRFYLENPPLYRRDGGWDGFCWIDPDNKRESVLSYRRIDDRGRELVVVLNFTPVCREDLRLGLPEGRYREVFNSDDESYGGGGRHNGVLKTEPVPCHGQAQSVRLVAPPLSCVILSKAAPRQK